MVQIAKINNQNLSFGRPNMPAATKKIAEGCITRCQYINMPGGRDCVRILRRFPDGSTHTETVPTDYFLQCLGAIERGISAFVKKASSI